MTEECGMPSILPLTLQHRHQQQQQQQQQGAGSSTTQHTADVLPHILLTPPSNLLTSCPVPQVTAGSNTLHPDLPSSDSQPSSPHRIRRCSNNSLVGCDGIQIDVSRTSKDLNPGNARNVIISAMIGNILEWYDYLVFTNFGDVISRQFFPPTSVYSRLLSFYGIFAAGFITRPLGALVVGRIGDKYGRKTALVVSMYLMCIPTTLIGCLPTFDMVGIAAPILLVLIRAAQGFAVGGEFTSTIVFLVEHAPPERRGLYGSFAFASILPGVILGSLITTIFTAALTEDQLMLWGWRVPFLMSILGAALGVHIRRKLEEPEVPEGLEAPLPTMGLLRNSRVRITAAMVIVFLLSLLDSIGFFLVIVFLTTYFQEFVGLSGGAALAINTCNALVYMLQVPVGGWISDRFGRASGHLGASLLMMVAAYPLWYMFKTGSAIGAWFAQLCLALIMATNAGGLGASFCSLFAPGSRCAGVSVSHNLAGTIFGGTAPLLATALMKGTEDISSPAALLIISAALTFVGALLLRKFNSP